MATAAFHNNETATVTASYHRHDGTIRVTFHSYDDNADGFTLSELDALQVAMEHARRHMLSAEAKPRFAVIAPEDDVEARFREQLHHMQPVPT